jgi:hypothetical protein
MFVLRSWLWRGLVLSLVCNLVSELCQLNVSREPLVSLVLFGVHVKNNCRPAGFNGILAKRYVCQVSEVLVYSKCEFRGPLGSRVYEMGFNLERSFARAGGA